MVMLHKVCLPGGDSEIVSLVDFCVKYTVSVQFPFLLPLKFVFNLIVHAY